MLPLPFTGNHLGPATAYQFLGQATNFTIIDIKMTKNDHFHHRCHKSVKGTGRWIKRELLEMQEGRSKEEAKYLLQVYLVIYHE